MAYANLQHIPLRSAFLCQDCNSVGNNGHHCPACTSTALLSLECVLDRKPVRSENFELTYKFPIPSIALTAKVA